MATEFGGGTPIPKKAEDAGLYPVKNASNKLRAGYASGTDDILEPRDPAIFNGEDPDRNKELTQEVRRRYA